MANGYTFYGNVIGINKQGAGPAIRPDTQPRDQAEPMMEQGPYVVVADRVLEEHDWCLHHPNIQGIVAEFGGATSHGAVVAREEGIACVVNAKGASKVQPGEQISVDGQSGQVDVEGGGGAQLPEGEGDALKNFVWNNQSWMIADAGVQGHDEMVRYMTDFGLWNSYGSMGVIYDNGYAQVDQMPPDQEPFERFLRTQYPHLQNVGTEPPARGRFQPPADHPALQQGQAPGQMAQTDLYRFIWLNGVSEWRPVDPQDPNKAGTTHESMIAEMQQNGTWDWEQAMMGEAVAGIIYDSGKVEVFTGGTKPTDAPAMETWVRQQFPIAKEFEYAMGGMLNVMGSKQAFYGIPQQNLFNWLTGIGVVAAYGADYVHTLIARLKGGEAPAQVVSDLPPDVQEQIMDAINSPIRHMTPYDQEHTAAEGEALKCPNCGSHTVRGENLEKAEEAKYHCLACKNTWDAEVSKERGGITASTLTKGQRVQLTHPEYKGVRGTILDDGKRHEDLNEDQYDILLDNGEEISDIPESAFKKIKSAATSDPHFFFEIEELEGVYELEKVAFNPAEVSIALSAASTAINAWTVWKMYKAGTLDEFIAWAKKKFAPAEIQQAIDEDHYYSRAKPLPEDVLTGIEEPWLGNGYEGHPVMCYMCGNQRSASLGSRCATCGYVLSIRRDSPPKNEAPHWRVSTVIATDGTPTQMQVGSQVNGNQQTTHMYQTGQPNTVCGLPVTTLQPTSSATDLTNIPCPTCFGNRTARIKLADTDGHELTVGEWYMMHSDKYTVPDVIMVKEIGEDKTITANIEGDDKGLFPITITADEWHDNKYRFERYTPHKETHEEKTARKNYSPTQQNEFVNENLEGRARNIHKVTLDDTHYPVDAMEEGKTSYFTISADDPLGKHFLW